MLSLGISHKPALKSAMRNSIRDSDIGNSAFGKKLDLTKYRNPEDGIGGTLFRKRGKET
jgi:hypothetical protein